MKNKFIVFILKMITLILIGIGIWCLFYFYNINIMWKVLLTFGYFAFPSLLFKKKKKINDKVKKIYYIFLIVIGLSLIIFSICNAATPILYGWLGGILILIAVIDFIFFKKKYPVEPKMNTKYNYKIEEKAKQKQNNEK